MRQTRDNPPKKLPPPKPTKSRILLKMIFILASVVVGLVILIFSINPQTFREPVMEGLSQATGLKIKIKTLSWNLSKGLNLKCQGLQILSPETGEELLFTEELLLHLEWRPLLQKKVVFESITLVKPILKIPVQSSNKKAVLFNLENPIRVSNRSLASLSKKRKIGIALARHLARLSK